MDFNYQETFGGNTDGTPITQLRQDVTSINRFNDNDSHYSVESIKTSTDLREMINDINNNIKNKDIQNETNNKEKEKNESKSKEEIDEIQIKKMKKKNKKNKSKQTEYEDYIYDFILLFIIFMLMSQQFVKNFIGTYIKAININEQGVVPILGVAIYGLIFVSLFISSKIFINKIVDI
jgi:cation transport ATPase